VKIAQDRPQPASLTARGGLRRWEESGALTTTVNGDKRELRAGESLLIPRGAVHHHENPGAEPSRTLFVLNPGSIGRAYFMEIAKAVTVLAGLIRRG